MMQWGLVPHGVCQIFGRLISQTEVPTQPGRQSRADRGRHAGAGEARAGGQAGERGGQAGGRLGRRQAGDSRSWWEEQGQIDAALKAAPELLGQLLG